jgi:hypothetical protein
MFLRALARLHTYCTTRVSCCASGEKWMCKRQIGEGRKEPPLAHTFERRRWDGDEVAREDILRGHAGWLAGARVHPVFGVVGEDHELRRRRAVPGSCCARSRHGYRVVAWSPAR